VFNTTLITVSLLNNVEIASDLSEKYDFKGTRNVYLTRNGK